MPARRWARPSGDSPFPLHDWPPLVGPERDFHAILPARPPGEMAAGEQGRWQAARGKMAAGNRKIAAGPRRRWQSAAGKLAAGRRGEDGGRPPEGGDGCRPPEEMAD